MEDLLQVRVSTTGMASVYAQHDMLLPWLILHSVRGRLHTAGGPAWVSAHCSCQ
jgi:hypothetical protein